MGEIGNQHIRLTIVCSDLREHSVQQLQICMYYLAG